MYFIILFDTKITLKAINNHPQDNPTYTLSQFGHDLDELKSELR